MQCGIHSNAETREVGSDPRVVADTILEEVSSLSNSVANNEGQLCSVPTNEPTSEAQPTRALPRGETAQVADVAEDVNFDPQLFWLLLAQAEYESW